MTGAIFRISPEKNLELRFTARRAEKLEALLGDGLVNGLQKIDRIGVMSQYIACGADISREEALDAFDEFVEGGGTINDAAEVVMEALTNGGFITRSAANAVKKIQDQLSRRITQQS